MNDTPQLKPLVPKERCTILCRAFIDFVVTNVGTRCTSQPTKPMQGMRKVRLARATSDKDD